MFVSWQLLRRIVTFLRSSLSISSILIRNALSVCNQHETNTLKRVGFSWLLIARESLCDTTQQSHSGHDHSRLCMLKTKNPTCDNHRHSRHTRSGEANYTILTNFEKMRDAVLCRMCSGSVRGLTIRESGLILSDSIRLT